MPISILRVESSLDDTPPMEFGNIEVGLKMSSYTISSLKPSQNYKITLCMKKGGFSIGVSSTLVRTKGENYMHGLGKNTINDANVELVTVVTTKQWKYCRLYLFFLSLTLSPDFETKKLIFYP